MTDPELAIPKSMKFRDSDFQTQVKVWNGVSDVSGWYIYPKFDGMRGYFDGEDFYNNNGIKINVPDTFKEGIPKQPMDGELW